MDSLTDHGFQVQGLGMLMPEKLPGYEAFSKIYGDHGNPRDTSIGFNWFPFGRKEWRLSLQGLYLEDSPMPYPKDGQEPYMLRQMNDLFHRHPQTTMIWAHIGLGRVVRPLPEQVAIVEKICTTPSLSHVYMDISWDEVAKYANETLESATRTAPLLNQYPDRFLFGSDCVAPPSRCRRRPTCTPPGTRCGCS